MSARVAHIWRHPIKAHGREELKEIGLLENQTMPWDRAWAVLHERAHTDGSHWISCGNFTRAAKAPSLQGIEAAFDTTTREITLTHPDQPPITFHPDDSPAQFIQWANRLIPPGRARATRLVRAHERGMTDTPFPSISLLNLASNRAVGQRLGRPISLKRWRGNLFFEGLAPWEEFEWIGKRLRIGEAILKVQERIGRCQATSVDPATGQRDTDMLRILKDGWGHTQFGVYATVEKGGRVALDDGMEVLP